MSNKYKEGESGFPLNDCYMENEIKAGYARKCVYPRNSLPTICVCLQHSNCFFHILYFCSNNYLNEPPSKIPRILREIKIICKMSITRHLRTTVVLFEKN